MDQMATGLDPNFQYISLNESKFFLECLKHELRKDVILVFCECMLFCMRIRLCNDYLHYVNYPSDASVSVQTSSVCGIVRFSTGPACTCV